MEAMTVRLIDGDALIKKFNEKVDMAECLIDARTAERFATFCALADAVEEMPTIDAEVVVRCKDCKYWQNNNNGYPHEECRWGHGETPDDNDFCSYGERKGSDSNG